MIKNYFLAYDLLNSDFTIRLGSKEITRHAVFHDESNWRKLQAMDQTCSS